MSVRLRLHGVGLEQVAFCCSPTYETLRSLHVLIDVKHHPLHISWAVRTRARMSSALKEECEAFSFWYMRVPLLFQDIWPPAETWSWEEETTALRKAPIEHFAEPLIQAALIRNGRGRRIPLDSFLKDSELREEALTRVETRRPASLPVLRELIADPEQCRERFATFLSAYRSACILPDWPDLETRLRDDIRRRGLALARHGLPRMLEGVSPRVREDRSTGEVVLPSVGPRGGGERLDLILGERDRVLIAPSHFAWPEMTVLVHKDLVDGEERQTLWIVHALAEMQEEGHAPVPPGDLLKLLRSAGDPTRLQILQLLAQRPRSTREIAGLIRLTEAAISKHLKLLQEAGWVVPERNSYYVYYTLVREARGKLTHGLERALG
ncbi:DUF5937 family protein [Streptomyces sp. JV176]|uniref:ArsR/SmtB family transcription factor n=1 Tax=Streptomyces sp. JV176 TaxID=858630 RepID=UPI002E75E3A6|nr:DUF5937 family protein [Streptomyces sp. JV176]MEE1799480.1 DUF5937 family protein [Streptomyces sp. JV176]